ncbi:hypothetical protein Ddye_018655 [Dipteronia dyeriana]|uniref:Uncharacterized protein n=1 Tax=Dipteronia dyeriana TaxID=168575 RepID=A0AAD9X1L8_9ROSI|nr:hypothetical protein Ddye_018655 [Dipteronia dyeriana]
MSDNLGSGLWVGDPIEAQTRKDPHCADVAWYFYPCVDYLGGLDVAPSKASCDQLKDLNTMALKEKKGFHKSLQLG